MNLIIIFFLAAISIPRIVRLIVHDTITIPIREYIFTYYPPHDAPGSYWQMTTPKKRSEYRIERNFWRIENKDRLPDQQYIMPPVRYIQHINQVRAGTFIGDLFSCHYCIGVWVSILVTVMVLLVPYGFIMLIPFALAQISDLIIDLMQRG